MTIFARIQLCLLGTIALLFSLHGESLDHTLTVSYRHFHYPFHDNDIVRGFVRLNGGFSVPPGSTGIMDTLFTVSGTLSLNETGKLQLLKNLEFDSGVTLTSGGNIDGRNNALLLNSNFTLTDNKILHITGNTIIDGRNHDLLIGNHAQIFVDTNITLTLRNLTLYNNHHALTFPPIRLAAHTSKLALDNVILAPTGDFQFPQGQMYIHNDVTFTGTSAFIYQSTRPSWITSGATLFFDHGTTFSIAPATITDAPYTLKNTYTDCNFIKLADRAASLYLNSCTLKATNTGLRLTKGTVVFDNAVALDNLWTNSIHKFSDTSYESDNYGGPVASIEWSPDGRYVAIGGYTTQTVNVYQFTESALTLIATSASYGGEIRSIRWSPDGQFIAVGGITAQTVKVYQFTGTALNLVATSADYLGTIYTVSWSPDGKYITAGGGTTRTIRIYQFTGAGFANGGNHIAESLNYGGNIFALAWHPDGTYIAAGGDGSQSAKVYQFTGSALTLVATSTNNGSDINHGIAWSPDGRYLAVGQDTTKMISVYQFVGSAFTNVGNSIANSADYGGEIRDVAWTPDGQYIVAAGHTACTAKVYQFTGSDFANDGNPIATSAQYGSGDSIFALSVSPDGKNVAVAGDGTSPYTVEVFPLLAAHYTKPQAYSNAIIFGDSSKGTDYNANVQLNSGARITVNGTVFDDSTAS